MAAETRGPSHSGASEKLAVLGCVFWSLALASTHDLRGLLAGTVLLILIAIVILPERTRLGPLWFATPLAVAALLGAAALDQLL